MILHFFEAWFVLAVLTAPFVWSLCAAAKHGDRQLNIGD